LGRSRRSSGHQISGMKGFPSHPVTFPSDASIVVKTDPVVVLRVVL